MKNCAMLAVAMTLSSALAADNYSKVITDRLKNYAGLSKDKPAVDLAKDESVEEKPRVMAFGYETAKSSSNGLIGYELGLNMDLGWSWALPLYNEDQYLVFRQRGSLFAGGRQYFSFTLYAVRIYAFLDLWAGKATAESYLRYDIVNYEGFCNAAQYLIDVMRASLLF